MTSSAAVPNADGGGLDPRIRAVIDVGTNSVKLLVARVLAEQVEPIDEASQTTRLGKGFYPGRILQADAILSTAQCVGEFARQARRCGASSIRVVATSAAREAFNAAELIEAIRTTTGLEMEIISGEQEADWVFHGVMGGVHEMQGPVLVMDVGGGSTEFIVGQGKVMRFRRSFQLGVVRLNEELVLADPPGSEAEQSCIDRVDGFLAREVEPRLGNHLNPGQTSSRLIGVGGTATVLAAMAQGLDEFVRERLDGAVLSDDVVIEWCKRLWSLPLVERQRIPGLPPKRADVILTGAAIYVAVMRRFRFPSLVVSTRGLRYAAIV